MPDYYRLLDQARSLPERLRTLPQTVRELPTQLRVSVSKGAFSFKQAGLAVALLGTVAFARHVAPQQNGGGKKTPDSGVSGGGRASKTPADVQGRWVMATSGATNFWSHDTGVYQGSGHGLSQIYEFSADGSYKTFVYMEVRTNYSWVKMNNKCSGTVEFNGDHLTLHAAQGHFDAEGTSYVNRDMTAEDLAKWSHTYRWRRENGADGQPRLFLDNENAAKPETTEYKVLAD